MENFAPGALYTDTCPCCTDGNMMVFEIAAVQANIVYNRYGWHDPQGRFFVLKEDIEREGTLENYIAKVECGEICPEPLVIRANAGDCIEIRFTNLLPEYIEASPFQLNGIRLLDKNNELIKTTEQELTGGEAGHEAPDHEDTGEKGYNYRSERFLNRLKRIPEISKIFDSKAHGDPSTPLLKSYVGERVMIRLLMPADKPRNISFLLHGHRRRAQPNDPLSSIIPVQGAVSVGNVFNIEPEHAKCKGDYLYRSGSLRWDVESGMWGILRVMNRNIRCRCENACRRVTKRWKKKNDKK